MRQAHKAETLLFRLWSSTLPKEVKEPSPIQRDGKAAEVTLVWDCLQKCPAEEEKRMEFTSSCAKLHWK